MNKIATGSNRDWIKSRPDQKMNFNRYYFSSEVIKPTNAIYTPLVKPALGRYGTFLHATF